MILRNRNNVRDVTTTVATTGLSFAAALIAGIVLSRVLGPSGKGQLAQLAVWAAFIVDVFLLGAPGATTYSVARWPAHRRMLMAAIGPRLFAQMAIGLLVYATLAIARSGSEGLPALAAIAYGAWIPAAMGVQIATGYLQGRGDFVRFNYVRLLSQASPVVALTLLAAVSALSVSSGALAYAAATTSALLFGWMWTRADTEELGEPQSADQANPEAVLRESRSYAWREYVSTLATKSNRSVDLLIVSLLPVAVSDIGIYSVAASSSAAIALVGVSVGMVAFSRAAQGGHARALRLLVIWGGILTAVAAAALYLLAPTLIPLVYGVRFGEAVALVRILVLGAAAISAGKILGGILRGLGRPGSVAIAELSGAAATVLGILILGTADLRYVAYSAVAGFCLTLVIEVAMLAANRRSAQPDTS